MCRYRWLLLAPVCLMLTASLSQGQALQTTATGPVQVSVPRPPGSPLKIWMRGAQGPWQPAPYRLQGGSLSFDLDPGRLGGSTLTLLLNPPPGMVLNDDRGPVVTGLKVDGKGCPLEPIVNLGLVKAAPRTLVAAFRDTANRVDPASARVTLNGEPLAANRLTRQVTGPRDLRVTAALPPLEYGRYDIALMVADTSPQANITTVRLKLEYADTTNVALASRGAKVSVDSCFDGYTSLVCLNDGVTALPGDTCPNELTWASAETDTDHWVEVKLPQVTTLREVTLYWAGYTNAIHTPRHFEVQVPAGETWQTLYKSPAAGEKPRWSTTARFCPTNTDRFRVFMPAGQGSESRPRLLWLAEVQAR